MASEDVIELGSSDDEAEPAPKKKKPMPNAMVHIPTKLPGLTIKPAKLNVPPGPKILNSKIYNLPKGVLSKPIMISKTNLNINTNINKHKHISTPLYVPVVKNLPKITKPVGSNLNRLSINPISIAKNLKKPELVIKKIASNRRLKNPVHESKLLNNLLPGITIKPLTHAGASGLSKKRNVQSLKNAVGEVLTVEIDDEESVESSIASPQWYLRPEEQEDLNATKVNDKELSKSDNKIELTLEEQNNKEPDTANFVEITIEDSPVKPLQLKDRSEIGKELSIIIEDSPVKPIKNKEVNSDREQNVDKVPHSKKKLDYPKDSAVRQVVEIEIDLMETGTFNYNQNKDVNKQPIELNISNQDNLEKKPDDEKNNSTQESVLPKLSDTKTDTANCEFHPTYQNFIDMCFELENSEDMTKIVEKKIKAYYKQCPKEYVESEEFIDMVSSKIVSMKSAPDKMYLYIKDIVDELNLQRKMTKKIAPKTTDTVQESEKFVFGEESEYDSKRQRQIRKLEKTIKKLHRAIQKLEEQEVDFDDDEDSVYLLTERYKERMVRVHAKFCQLTNTKMPSEPRIHLEVRPGRPAGPVRKLEKWINKKVPIGTPLPFPDFHDVLQCVRGANDEDKLGWNEVDIMEEARDLFMRCGKKLQRRRQENEWRLAVSRISNEMDLVEESVDLKKKLDENKSKAHERETELLNKYVDRQNQLKLVAEEIGDKEAEESPVESEEEEQSEVINPLESKHKRKERLKRLLQEKNRKNEEKENIQNRNKLEEEKESHIKTNEKSEQLKQMELETKTEDDNSNKIDIVVNDDQVESKETSISENVNENTKKITEDEKGESDENEFESDIDELHLLQKLHSENESDASTVVSSDSDSPIAISDTSELDTDVENKNYLSDVISIENSSYSESEAIDGLSKGNEDDSVKKSKVEDLVSAAFEVEYVTTDPMQTENENIIENILLASSDDESSNKIIDGTCINLKDDDISVSETTINGEASLKVNIYNKQSWPKIKNHSTIQDDSVKNENVTISIDKQSLEQDNGNVDSVIESSDVYEVTNSSELSKDETDHRSLSDNNSVEIVDMQIEQIEDSTNSSQTESVEIITSSNTEPSEVNENKESDIQNEIVQTLSTANIETAINNMET